MSEKSIKKSSYLPLVTLTLSLLIFFWAASIASGQLITQAELNVFRYINDMPDTFRSVFLVISLLGSSWILYGLTLLMVLLKQNRLALRIFLAGFLAFLIANGLKFVVVRPRPYLILSDVHLRVAEIGSGFPSAHTAVATALSLVLLPYMPYKWRWLAGAWIVLVAVSRVYLGVHAPMDTVGGFAIGVAVVSGSLILKNKLRFVTKITGMKLTD